MENFESGATNDEIDQGSLCCCYFRELLRARQLNSSEQTAAVIHNHYDYCSNDSKITFLIARSKSLAVTK